MSSVSEKEFNALLVQYRPFILGQVLRNNGGDNTEDYVQDVILQVCRVRESFDPDKGSFPTWLWWQIRSCLQQRRAQQRKRQDISRSMEYYDDGEPVYEASVLGNQQASVELQEALKAVYELKPRQQYAILQRAVGATFTEIGAAYGATSQYAQELYASSIRALQKQTRRKEARAGAN